MDIMDILVPSIVAFLCLAVFLLSGQLIAFTLGLTGIILLYTFAGASYAYNSINVIYSSLNSYTLMAVPMYIFMGTVILHSGIGSDLYTGVSRWIGGLPGGLLHTNVISCAIFAAVSGSSVATAATIGTVAYPHQTELGYNKRLVLGSLAGSGTLGLLIPPSISLLVYGALVGVSIGKLFMGGMVPGIGMAVIFSIYIALKCKLQPGLAPTEARVSWKMMLKGLYLIGPVVVIILVVLGGIYTGVMTPTEAAGVGSAVALIVAALRRKVKIWTVLQQSLMETVKICGMIFIVIMAAFILGYSLTTVGLPRFLATFITGLPVHPLVIMAGIYLLYIMLGCLMGAIEMMVLTLSVVFPVIINLGFDPIWFGVTLTMLIELAQITPPVGYNLFVLHGITKQPISDIIRGAIPFGLLLLLGIGVVTAFPSVVLWLPNMMMKPIS